MLQQTGCCFACAIVRVEPHDPARTSLDPGRRPPSSFSTWPRAQGSRSLGAEAEGHKEQRGVLGTGWGAGLEPVFFLREMSELSWEGTLLSCYLLI